MKIELLKEPYIEFGSDFLCDEPKMGVTVGGFFSLSSQTHRSEIHCGIIGTNNNIQDTKDWLKKFEQHIEATVEEKSETSIEDKAETEIVDGEIIEVLTTSTKLFELEEVPQPERTYEQNKKINPDFPGFNSESVFKCSYINDETNNLVIKESTISDIFKEDIKAFDKAVRIGDLYIEAYKRIINDSISKPTLCLIIIPTKVFDKLSSIPFGQGKFFNLRRYLKAQLISLPNAIPVQIILEDTITGKKKSMQDLSMQAWNFAIASYYKNGGIPWTLTLKDKNTCFIGISFNKVLNIDTNLMRSSVAQAFNYEGKGIIFIGKKFEWNPNETNTPAPHLTHDYARDLIKQVLEEYKRFNKGLPPTRVVIHKTTDFWNSSIHEDYAEVEGFKYGIKEAIGENVEIDLVTIKSSPIKLLRETGKYPVMRGTLLELDKSTGVLYTTGYIPYYETFPGVHIPRPFEISIYEGESTLRKVCEEIMALSKMNFNNCNYYDSLPITLRFAQKVGEIIQYIDEGVIPPNKYYFYM